MFVIRNYTYVTWYLKRSLVSKPMYISP